jgi:hypothetical protein
MAKVDYVALLTKRVGYAKRLVEYHIALGPRSYRHDL